MPVRFVIIFLVNLGNTTDFDQAKEPQIERVLSLLNGHNTFLLAGTGFGKSRVPEMLFHMFPKVSKPVVLVLNPLDTLGNNQVRSGLVFQVFGQ